MSIPTQDATAIFTDTLVRRFAEMPKPTIFLQTFFRSQFKPAKNVRISVRRGSEFIAVDVHRHSNGNLNITSFDDEKKFKPPFYDEYVVLNDHELYDNVIGIIASINAGNPNTDDLARLRANLVAIMDELAQDMVMIRDKQIRSVELQCAQIFNDGIIILDAAASIDYKRKTASKVDLGGGNYWADAGSNPYNDLEAGCQFLRKTGLSSTAVFDAVFDPESWQEFLDNAEVKERQDIRRIDLGNITGPLRNAEGAGFHGEISAGSYRVRLWTYDQYFTDPADGLQKPYLAAKKVTLIPEAAEFDIAWCLVPQLTKDGTIPQTSEFLVQEFFNEEAVSHTAHVKSAPIAIPTAVDKIYTLQVKA